jgi:hypothetical protein
MTMDVTSADASPPSDVLEAPAADVAIDASPFTDALEVPVQDAAVDVAHACAPHGGPLGWSPWSGNLPAAALNAVWGSSARDVWAVGDNGTAVHWDCATWSGVPTPAPISDLRGVWGSSSTDVWAVGGLPFTQGRVFHWDGTSWSLSLSAPFPPELNAVWGASADDVWAVGGNGFVTSSGLQNHCDPAMLHWDGRAWSRVATPSSSAGWVLGAISGTSSVDVWAVGHKCFAGHNTSFPEALHWDGHSWSEVLTGLQYAGLSAVSATSGSNVWAGGDVSWDGGVAHLARWNGSAWTVDPTASDTVSSIWAGNPTMGWAVGVNGLVVGWDGNQWTRTASGTAFDLHGVWGSSAKEAWAVGGASSGIVLHYQGQ